VEQPWVTQAPPWQTWLLVQRPPQAGGV
jgi:hypothetical protein